MAKEIEIELLSPMREGGGTGTSDYNQLENKPQINGVELVGNKTTEELGINIPTKVSQLENDSNYATEDYVDTHGGKIDKITVNGTEQPIVDKTVNIDVPEKTSDLTNDSNFVNEQFINDAVKTESDRAIEVEDGISDSLNAHVTNTNNPHNVTKTQVGLGNVDNTSDKNKPISDATQSALDGKLDKSTAVTSFSQAYTKSADGVQTFTEISTTKTSNTLAKRDKDGRLEATDGVENDDVATVGQMNTAVTNVDTKINNEITRATGVEDDINLKVSRIQELIPTTASSDNQLADKAFVNSSVNSVAATFRGNFATKAALDTWQTENPGVAKQNDYAIVQQDETHDGEQWRYLFQDGAWVAQYKVNDAPFTEEQNAAINSTITKTIVDNTTAHIANKNNPHGVTKAQLGLENVDNTSDLNKPVSTATQTALTHLQETMDEQISALNAAIENKQDPIEAGNGITIDGNKVNADSYILDEKITYFYNYTNYVSDEIYQKLILNPNLRVYIGNSICNFVRKDNDFIYYTSLFKINISGSKLRLNWFTISKTLTEDKGHLITQDEIILNENIAVHNTNYRSLYLYSNEIKQILGYPLTTKSNLSSNVLVGLNGNSSIESNQQVNIDIGDNLELVDNKLNAVVPTKTSELTNDSNFATIDELNTKQDNLTTTQLNAVNSGITSAKVTQYDGYATSKQDKLTDDDLGYGLGFVDGKLSVTIPDGTDKEY